MTTDAPTILVVDDEQSYRDALAVALEREGFRVELAADDYVSKPFRLRELVARVRAAMRRSPDGEEPLDDVAEVLDVGDVRLDAGRHEVFVRDELVALPLKEFELLELLLAN